MSKKPTFIEYIFSRRAQYVRTLDGRYYIVENEPKPRRFSIFLAALVLYYMVQLTVFFVLKQMLWRNLQFDFALIGIAGSSMLSYRRYRSVKFSDISGEEENLKEARTLGFNRYESRFWALCYVLFAALLLLHSLSIFSLRSVIEHDATVTRIIVTVDGYDVYDAGGGELEQHGSSGYNSEYARFYISIKKTPAHASFRLDGNQLTEGLDQNTLMSWLFDADYLKQSYELYIPKADIHDGSVLEMTCGDLYRKWVFDIEDAA